MRCSWPRAGIVQTGVRPAPSLRPFRRALPTAVGSPARWLDSSVPAPPYPSALAAPPGRGPVGRRARPPPRLRRRPPRSAESEPARHRPQGRRNVLRQPANRLVGETGASAVGLATTVAAADSQVARDEGTLPDTHGIRDGCAQVGYRHPDVAWRRLEPTIVIACDRFCLDDDLTLLKPRRPVSSAAAHTSSSALAPDNCAFPRTPAPGSPCTPS